MELNSVPSKSPSHQDREAEAGTKEKLAERAAQIERLIAEKTMSEGTRWWGGKRKSRQEAALLLDTPMPRISLFKRSKSIRLLAQPQLFDQVRDKKNLRRSPAATSVA